MNTTLHIATAIDEDDFEFHSPWSLSLSKVLQYAINFVHTYTALLK